MSRDLKVFLEERRKLKSKLTRFSNISKDIMAKAEPDVDEIEEISNRLEGIIPIMNEFERITSDIILNAEPNTHDLHERDLAVFESTYYQTVARVKNFVSQFNSNNKGTIIAQASLVNDTSNFVNLPNVNLPSFNGEFDQWLEFHDAFDSLIHNNAKLTNVQKLHYLKSSLTGEAARAVRSLKITSDNYDVAWNLLRKRFEKKKLIVQNNIKAFFNLEPIRKDSHLAMQRLLGDISRIMDSLKNYNQPTLDIILIYIVSSKLSLNTRQDWENRKYIQEFPTFDELLIFLEERCDTLGSLEVNKIIQNVPSTVASTKWGNQAINNTKAYMSTTKPNCFYCAKDNHTIYNCESFAALDIPRRITEARRLRLCINCLKKNHSARICSLKGCSKCHRKHNALLHIENTEYQDSDRIQNSSPQPQAGGSSSLNISETANVSLEVAPKRQISCISHTNDLGTITETILSTACVEVFDIYGNTHTCRALLDPGSQLNFVTAELSSRLGLPKLKCNSVVSGISRSTSHIQFKTHIEFKSRVNNYKANIACLILDKITDHLPITSFDLAGLNIPPHLKLADSKCNVTAKIDMLLGANIFWELLCVGQHRLGKNKPILQKTNLGWILGGYLYQNVSTPSTRSVACLSISENSSIDNQLTKFWTLEECLNNNYSNYSTEEQFCENHFVETTKRTATGRFVVSIPFKPELNVAQLGQSKDLALKRFYSLERKLDRDLKLQQDYTSFIKEYESLGHMTKIDLTKAINEPHYFLPHHAVFKSESSTTKLRVVFDASAKTTSGLSLNDVQSIGPVIQSDLFSIVLRFRMHPYVITADIAKMYRQILVQENQRNFQLILWRPNKDQPVECYRLNTITYGTASASFLAVRCLKQLAIENRDNYPTASDRIEHDFYMDDLLTGFNTVEEAVGTQREIARILNSACLELRKWSSNSSDILTKIEVDSNIEHAKINLSGENQTKTLGILWNSCTDKLQYEAFHFTKQCKVTKRTILSTIAQIFDPLGLLGPVIIVAKRIMQKLWKYKLSWDEGIPLDLNTQWLHFRNQLGSLSDFQVSRHVMCENPSTVELHGFCDASESAYGACIYIKTMNNAGIIQVSLLCAKSRVAPVKKVTLPRLELCGAVLMAQLASKVQLSTKINFDRLFYWSDSTIALSWINGAPNKWKTFVANRVAEIQTLSRCEDWRHVRTYDNPADLLSRGIDPSRIKNESLWWDGPIWLKEQPCNWPLQPKTFNDSSLEVRSVAGVITKFGNIDIFSKYSSLFKLKRVAAYCFRFIHNAKLKPEDRLSGHITNEELNEAFLRLIRIEQANVFSAEVRLLALGKSVDYKGSLLPLNPFLDAQGILRVGGRIHNSNFDYNKKHPIILPNSHWLTKLIIRTEHLRLLHCGANQLLSSLRDKFWPINGRNMIKKIIHECISCFRVNPKPSSPIMGNLPKTRVIPAPPFFNSGVDYAGPVMIKERKGRGSKLLKAYICLFVCLATKAIHLELVTDLTTDAFLAALRRFMSRRGQPANIYSDNGTNFVGANSELRELKSLFYGHNKEIIIDRLSEHNTSWHFIPPRSPHFGGLWEAGVKSVKCHLKRVAGNAHLTYEEFCTLLIQIEAILNSRPLSPMSLDPTDLEPLTPAHFLIGRKLTSAPEPNLKEIADNRLTKYQHIQKLMQHFWSRWSKEYVSQLQTRSKWRKGDTDPVTIGRLVLLCDENLPPLRWQLGRIKELHPGSDGIVRVVSVQIGNGNVIKRAVRKVCVLPMNEEVPD